MYHVLQLGSALTEAVTAREVCDVVADQLLPAFGGQQLAIYVVRERRMHLLSQTGYPRASSTGSRARRCTPGCPATGGADLRAPRSSSSRGRTSPGPTPDIPAGGPAPGRSCR